MKQFIATCLALVCVLSLARCNTRPDTSEEISVDKVKMLHSTDGDTSSEEVTITDQTTISELLELYHSLRTKEMSRPIADERMWIVFYQEEEVMLEWCVSLYEDDGTIMTCSKGLGIGNHIVKSELDYDQILERFNAAMG